VSLLLGVLLGGLLFGGNRCDCSTCLKARRKADEEFAQWYLKNKGTSVSHSPSTSPSSSVSLQTTT